MDLYLLNFLFKLIFANGLTTFVGPFAMRKAKWWQARPASRQLSYDCIISLRRVRLHSQNGVRVEWCSTGEKAV